ncbi:MAG: hypothetical protein AAF633_14240, partial [Chloroflexota bacterium]
PTDSPGIGMLPGSDVLPSILLSVLLIELGLIAQEVEAVIGNVVTYNSEQDKYGVNYTELIPVLIRAIQEQQDIIRLQQTKIDNLGTRIKAIETSNNDITH